MIRSPEAPDQPIFAHIGVYSPAKILLYGATSWERNLPTDPDLCPWYDQLLARQAFFSKTKAALVLGFVNFGLVIVLAVQTGGVPVTQRLLSAQNQGDQTALVQNSGKNAAYSDHYPTKCPTNLRLIQNGTHLDRTPP